MQHFWKQSQTDTPIFLDSFSARFKLKKIIQIYSWPQYVLRIFTAIEEHENLGKNFYTYIQEKQQILPSLRKHCSQIFKQQLKKLATPNAKNSTYEFTRTYALEVRDLVAEKKRARHPREIEQISILFARNSGIKFENLTTVIFSRT